jgi:hypothetical protein
MERASTVILSAGAGKEALLHTKPGKYLEGIGGDDGARTRDLRRDRPAF